jgi:hypothetical protein
MENHKVAILGETVSGQKSMQVPGRRKRLKVTLWSEFEILQSSALVPWEVELHRASPATGPSETSTPVLLPWTGFLSFEQKTSLTE